jgi:hypothetical protein
MNDKMNIRMIDRKAGRTAVPRYGRINIHVYNPVFCKMSDCRETGTFQRQNIGTLEYWNVPTLERQNVGTQEHWNIGTFICWNIGTFAKTSDSSNICWKEQVVEQTNKQTNGQINKQIAA